MSIILIVPAICVLYAIAGALEPHWVVGRKR